jgi:hypothetical protein
MNRQPVWSASNKIEELGKIHVPRRAGRIDYHDEPNLEFWIMLQPGFEEIDASFCESRYESKHG